MTDTNSTKTPFDTDEQQAQDLAKTQNTELAPQFDEEIESEDSLTFSNNVIEKIVALAVRDIDGVAGMKGGLVNTIQETFGQESITKGVEVEVNPDDTVRVDIAIFIEYGAYAPKIFEDIKHAVFEHVKGMTGLEVSGVNLRIEDVLTPEELADDDEDDDEAEDLPF